MAVYMDYETTETNNNLTQATSFQEVSNPYTDKYLNFDNTNNILENSDQQFNCDICHKQFEKMKNLKRHKKLHNPEKKYKCDKCDAAYSRSDHLQRHSVIHSQDTKPFKCEFCVQRFSNKCHLRKHLKNIHAPSKEEKILLHCDKCEMSFNKKSKLSKHIAQEHSENLEMLNKYRCYYPFCNRLYHSKGKLENHIAHAHDNLGNTNKEKGYLQCPFEECKKSYTTPYNLKVHIKTFHYKVLEFKCELENCERSFKHKCSLIKHQIKCHLSNSVLNFGMERQTPNEEVEKLSNNSSSNDNSNDYSNDISNFISNDYHNTKISNLLASCYDNSLISSLSN